jgi:alpha-beta hydrolase superfamily lysophospholipase
MLVEPGTYVPNDRDVLYRWDHGTDDYADLRDVARQIAGGPLGWIESYFPQGLQLDLIAGYFGSRQGDLAAAKHIRAAEALPTLLLQAGDDHVVPLILKTFGIVPTDRIVCGDYTHLDTLTAKAGSDEPVSSNIAAFVAKHTVPEPHDTRETA